MKNFIEVGYIVIDPSVDREKYIQNCIRTSTLNVIGESGTIYVECPVMGAIGNSDKDGEYISPYFPIENEEKVPVLLAFPLGKHRPIVLGTVPVMEKIVIIESEGDYKSVKNTKECSISILKSPKKGLMNINIYGKESSSSLNVNVGSKTKDSKVNINVQGEVNVKSSGKINLTSESINLTLQNKDKQDKVTTITGKLAEGIEIKDEFENVVSIKSDGITVKSKNKLSIEAGGETNITSKGSMKIQGQGSIKIDDASSIEIGGASAKALNEDTPCFYSGQFHKCPTNLKTKV